MCSSDLDLPVFQDIEADAVGGALVHVGVILAGPGEGFVFRTLDTGEGNPAAFEHFEMLDGEIVADDADEIDRAAKERGGERGVGGGTTEEVPGFGFGGFDVVDGDGAADDDSWGSGRGGHGEAADDGWELREEKRLSREFGFDEEMDD